jgi:two-component system, NarL family, nitrate/nitrite response regulator NarL
VQGAKCEVCMDAIRIVIAHPHPVIVQGLSSVLEAQPEFKIVGRCTDVAGCIEAIRMFKPHITVAGISMPGMGGLEILAFANSGNALTRVVLFATAVEERDLQTLAGAGAYAVLPQDVDLEILVQVLRQVAGAPRLRAADQATPVEQHAITEKPAQALTDRERQIMRLASEGLSNKEIGRRLNLTDGTIKVHLHHIFQKLEVTNRTALAALAMSQDIYPASSLDD